MVSLIAVLAVANSLKSDEGENVEYDRALVELTASLMPGDPDDARDLVEAVILDKRHFIVAPRIYAPPPFQPVG